MRGAPPAWLGGPAWLRASAAPPLPPPLRARHGKLTAFLRHHGARGDAPAFRVIWQRRTLWIALTQQLLQLQPSLRPWLRPRPPPPHLCRLPRRHPVS
jgi:hypothetical protein